MPGAPQARSQSRSRASLDTKPTQSPPDADASSTTSNQDVSSRGVKASPRTSPTTANEDNDDSWMPARWWYAQTAFPLCAGTFGPMANAFSVCALVENWRIAIPADGLEKDGSNIKDPSWLIAVNAVSLACALIANMSLLLNMTKRISFSVAQTITILGFWISSVLLIGLIATASHHFQAPDVPRQALTQAYYYACWAAGLYQIISYLMCITVYGALTGKYDREFSLTTSQRTLMLQTIAFLTYLLLGALIFSRIEGWQYLDAVYWADFTLLTVGVGDYAPTTHLGRSLLFPFAVGGIVVLGLVVGSIRSLILDSGKEKLSARMTEKLRRGLVKEIQVAHAGKKRLHRTKTGISQDVVKQIAQGPLDSADDERGRRETEFGAMRKVQTSSERRQKWMDLLFSVLAWAMLWFFGALVFSYTEQREQQWSYFVSVYFAYTSLLTIGYGDFSPTSNSGKAFFVFWSLLAIPSLTILISDMSDTVVRFIKEITIWLGEVTILPSDEGSVRESLEYGLSKATHKLNRKVSGHTSSLGLSKMSWAVFKHRSHSPHDSHESEKQPGSIEREDETDRMAKAFEKSEARDEDQARRRSDTVAEDEHHHRRQLISAIRRIYADSHLTTPKRYSYTEWSYFLRLLGEDEGSSDHHALAPLKPQHEHREGPERWSWVGPRSPLMSGKREPVLLLELFFEKLEHSFTEPKPQKRHEGNGNDTITS